MILMATIVTEITFISNNEKYTNYEEFLNNTIRIRMTLMKMECGMVGRYTTA